VQEKRDAPKREFYKVSEVARIFGVSPQAVYKWIDEEKVKVIPLGNVYRIPESEVERLRLYGLEPKEDEQPVTAA
jgi:excisionase family DNA binding protein